MECRESERCDSGWSNAPYGLLSSSFHMVVYLMVIESCRVHGRSLGESRRDGKLVNCSGQADWPRVLDCRRQSRGVKFIGASDWISMLLGEISFRGGSPTSLDLEHLTGT